MAVSIPVCEICSVKEWRDLEKQVRVVQGHKPLLSMTHMASATPDLRSPSQPKLVLIVPTHGGMARLS